MLTYLIILLDDTSVSYCGYCPLQREQRLMPLDVLQRGIVWAMKENLNIQMVYPHYQLPKEYRDTIETIDHTKIGPSECGEQLDVTVVADLAKADGPQTYLWQCTLDELQRQQEAVANVVSHVRRLNVVLTNVAGWKEQQFADYKEVLDRLADHLLDLYARGKAPQLNLLTDRLILQQMNNCGAGDTSVTLAPDGRFYVCPAFYPGTSVGSLAEGLAVPNQQLYKVDHAPICRACDAWQCCRCVWQSEQLTGDANTPSHQQCVAAHLERNASRRLQQELKRRGVRLEDSSEIKEIDYLDPFNIVNRWK